MNLICVCKKYAFMLEQLIMRDFKVKYKRSFLGVLWSLLYPVLTMGVMALIFTNFFKMTLPGISYLTYLMSGLVAFNYFSEATNLAMSSVVANFPLINKIYIPKYLFPLEKCIFTLINFALSLIPLYAIIILTGTGLNLFHVFLPLIYILLFIFTVGVGLILSTVSVFARDTFYIYGIFITLLQYLTPIVYDVEYIPEIYRPLLKLNPLYWYVTASRDIILYHQAPSIPHWFFCIVFAAFFFFLGTCLFRKYQNKFIYYA